MNFLLKLIEFIAGLFGVKAEPPSPKPTIPPPGPLSPDLIAKISSLAASSSAASISWRDRGEAPMGYMKGMAVTFGEVYRKYLLGDSAAKLMARGVVESEENDKTDALSWYNSNFRAVGMSNDVAGRDTLRHLFMLMTGLGMRESSGRYCEGRDRSASNVTADTAESGLYQMSWDAHGASVEIPKLLQIYTDDPKLGFQGVFKEGVTPRTSDWEIYGTGTGAAFQKMCKSAPAFAVETAAVGLRTLRKHWGPINRKEVELRQEVDELFKQVQALIDGAPSSVARAPSSTSITETPTSVTPAQWPKESVMGALDAFYGDPRGDVDGDTASPQWLAENMVKIVPPYKMTYEGEPVNSIYIHKKCAASLNRILKKIWDHYGHDQNKIHALHLDEFDGSFNYRTNRNNPNKLSLHAYGAAIDIAAKWNPNGKPWRPNAGMLPLDVVRIFAAEGCSWGGQFNGTKDSMHFQWTYNTHANEPLPSEEPLVG